MVVLIVAVLVDVGNWNVLGYDITLHKGLDIVGGSQLTIAVCKGPDKPAGADPPCRAGPRNGITSPQAQSDTIPVLQNRVNGLGVSEASVQPVGSDQISIELPGVSLAKADERPRHHRPDPLRHRRLRGPAPREPQERRTTASRTRPTDSAWTRTTSSSPRQLGNGAVLPVRVPLEDR